jgi:hypothetical protein
MDRDKSTRQAAERQRLAVAQEKALGQKIAKKEGAGRDLNTLEKTGVPREEMLRLLAVTVDMLKNNSNDWAEMMRYMRDKLRSLAKQMDALALEVDKVLDNPFCKLQWWAYLVGCGSLLGMKPPSLKPWRDDPGVFLIPGGLGALSRLFQREADKFGQFLREFARKDAQMPVALLLVSVLAMRWKQGLVQKPDHLPELANLLTDAIEVAEINKYGRPRRGSAEKDNYFTPDALEKVWKRRGKRMLRRWYKLNFSAPEEAHQAALGPAGAVSLKGQTLPFCRLPKLV